MPSDAVTTTILQVRDGSHVVEFYRDHLGLDYKGTNTERQEMFSLAGGSQLALMPGPDATPTGRTELSLEVDDTVAEIRDLEDHGVAFADYDLPGLKTAAWDRGPRSQRALPARGRGPTGNGRDGRWPRCLARQDSVSKQPPDL